MLMNCSKIHFLDESSIYLQYSRDDDDNLCKIYAHTLDTF